MELRRSIDSRLFIWFRASGFSGVRLLCEGEQTGKQRQDALWEHTCCEAFIKSTEGYYEFNFAPGGDWACYHFVGYREGMLRPKLPAPNVSSWRHGDWWQMQAHVDLTTLANINKSKPLSIGISAVLETKEGEKTYWALAHPSDKPDFHHPDSFVLELP